MIGFEVSVNGEKLYTVGASDPGDITVFLSRYRKRHEKQQTLDVHAGGVNLLSPEGVEHLEWQHHPLAVGDEVTVRIVETLTPDTPMRQEIPDTVLNEKRRRQFYENLKAEYGD